MKHQWLKKRGASVEITKMEPFQVLQIVAEIKRIR